MFKPSGKFNVFLVSSLLSFVWSAGAIAASDAKVDNAIANKIGTVIVTQNTVEATRGDKVVALKRKSNIEAKDEISTGENARTQFRLVDGTLFTLGENSSLLIDDYLFSDKKNDKKANEAPHALFTLTKGAFRAVTGKITQVKSPEFKVKTPLGSIGIRGTDFWGGYLDAGKIDVFLVSGEHSVIVENEFGRVEIKNAGEGTTIEANKPPSAPKKWPQAKVQRAVATVTLAE